MKDKFITLLQTALHRYLTLDPESASHLQPLQGKRIQIELMGLDIVFQLVFTGQTINIMADELAIPDTLIKGTPLSLLRMTLTDQRKHFFENDVSIEGDVELGQQIMQLFDQLDIDWEEHLAQHIGDIPAHQLGRVARGVKNWCEKTRKIFTQNLNEYAHEEREWFPVKEQLQTFFNEIDDLRMAVDRLDLRIKELRK